MPTKFIFSRNSHRIDELPCFHGLGAWNSHRTLCSRIIYLLQVTEGSMGKVYTFLLLLGFTAQVRSQFDIGETLTNRSLFVCIPFYSDTWPSYLTSSLLTIHSLLCLLTIRSLLCLLTIHSLHRYAVLFKLVYFLWSRPS